MPGKQVDARGSEGRLQFVQALAGFSGGAKGGIAGQLVHLFEVFKASRSIWLTTVQIQFVEDQGRRHPIGLRRDEESIDEARASFRAGNGNDEKSPIQVGGNNVALLGQIDRAAHDGVAALLALYNKWRLILAMKFNDDVIAHSKWVGRPVVLQAQTPSCPARIHAA